MTKKQTASKGETEATVQVSPTVTPADETQAVENNEMVNEAGIDITVTPDINSITQNDEADNEKAAPETEDEITKLPSEMRGEAPETVTPEEPEPIKNELTGSDYTVILNTSLNPILLQGENEKDKILIAPKEIKSISRYLLRELLKSKVVRYWFDKGILTTNQDANETSANEAEAPAHLSEPVERHDGANISASVTKFEKQGSVTINL
jgi:hypothetical protein